MPVQVPVVFKGIVVLRDEDQVKIIHHLREAQKLSHQTGQLALALLIQSAINEATDRQKNAKR